MQGGVRSGKQNLLIGTMTGGNK
ncbi:MAG: hypothetical protein QOK01_838, partial [Alphaproteobacteria bacterium]|nr:hypothetical protein [Alphaproteobacteria bacterium]